MLKYFPLSKNAKRSIGDLIVALVIYIVCAWVVGFVTGLFGFVPIVNLLLSIVNWLVGIYCGVGLIVTLLYYFNVIKG